MHTVTPKVAAALHLLAYLQTFCRRFRKLREALEGTEPDASGNPYGPEASQEYNEVSRATTGNACSSANADSSNPACGPIDTFSQGWSPQDSSCGRNAADGSSLNPHGSSNNLRSGNSFSNSVGDNPHLLPSQETALLDDELSRCWGVKNEDFWEPSVDVYAQQHAVDAKELRPLKLPEGSWEPDEQRILSISLKVYGATPENLPPDLFEQFLLLLKVSKPNDTATGIFSNPSSPMPPGQWCSYRFWIAPFAAHMAALVACLNFAVAVCPLSSDLAPLVPLIFGN
mmetsp:Transcript_16740/g.46770  ORF Transcript_16740/g.46770 Transcript_16740/m.46770 type:complete len:285 (-) Transcript_16740:2702-3556(-)